MLVFSRNRCLFLLKGAGGGGGAGGEEGQGGWHGHRKVEAYRDVKRGAEDDSTGRFRGIAHVWLDGCWWLWVGAREGG